MKRPFSPFHLRSKQTGAVLVVVVFVLMLVSLWVLGFAKETLYTQRESADLVARKKAYQGALAGLEYSLFLLETQDGETLDGSHQLSDAQFRFQIRNEDGKWDLNSLVDGDGNIVPSRAKGLTRFLTFVGLEAGSKQIVQSLADWIDADQDPREEGAESANYSGYGSPDGPLQTFSEWQLIQGVGNLATAQRLRKGGTLFSTGKININSAPIEVVASLSGKMNEPLARAIVATRNKKRFQEVDDLKKVQGMSNAIFRDIESLLTEKGTYYSIVVQGESGEQKVSLGAIAKREEDQLNVVWFQKDLRDEDLLEWN